MCGTKNCSSLCSLCSGFSLLGAFFYGCAAVMVKRENQVFLTIHGGLKMFNEDQQNIDDLFFAVLYTFLVSYLNLNNALLRYLLDYAVSVDALDFCAISLMKEVY
jgi:hypothetical protein